ncbi:titin, partial [Selaginella moellendorffii]|uniref:titin n=1 Tax=Selaginella moellendorffii TaxID=88036 RepID=UPI000D1CAD92
MHATDATVDDTQRASPASEDIHDNVEEEQTNVAVPHEVSEREVELAVPVEELPQSGNKEVQEPQHVLEAVPEPEAVPEASEEAAKEVQPAEPVVAQVPTATVDDILPTHEEIKEEESIEPAKVAVDDHVENVEPRESASVAILQEGEKLAVPEMESGAPDSMHATDATVDDTQRAPPASEDIHENVEEEQSKVEVQHEVSEREVELAVPVEELPPSGNEEVQEPQPVLEAVPETEAVPEASEEDAKEVQPAEPVVAQVPTAKVDDVLPAHEEIKEEESIEPAKVAVDDQVENVEPRESASVAILQEGEKLAVPEIESGALDSMHATDATVDDTQRAPPASEDIHDNVEEEQSKVEVQHEVSEREVELAVPVEELPQSGNEEVQEPQPVLEAVPETEAVPEASEEDAKEVQPAEPVVAQVPTAKVDDVLPAHEEIKEEESIEQAKVAVDDQVENFKPRESASVAILQEGEKLAVPEIESGAPDSIHVTDATVDDTQRAPPASEDIHENVEEEQSKVEVPHEVSEREVELAVPVKELPESGNEEVQDPQHVLEAVPETEAVREAAEEAVKEVEPAEPVVAQVPPAKVDDVLPALEEMKEEENATVDDTQRAPPASEDIHDNVEEEQSKVEVQHEVSEREVELAVPVEELPQSGNEEVQEPQPVLEAVPETEAVPEASEEDAKEVQPAEPVVAQVPTAKVDDVLPAHEEIKEEENATVDDTQRASPASEDIHDNVEEEQTKVEVQHEVSERKVELAVPVEELPQSGNEEVQQPQPVLEAVPETEAVPEASEEAAKEVQPAEPVVAQVPTAKVDDVLPAHEEIKEEENATVDDTQRAPPASEDIHENVEEEQSKVE